MSFEAALRLFLYVFQPVLFLFGGACLLLPFALRKLGAFFICDYMILNPHKPRRIGRQPRLIIMGLIVQRLFSSSDAYASLRFLHTHRKGNGGVGNGSYFHRIACPCFDVGIGHNMNIQQPVGCITGS